MLLSTLHLFLYFMTFSNGAAVTFDRHAPKEGQIMLSKGREYQLMDVNNGGLFLGLPASGGVPASLYEFYSDMCKGAGVSPKSVQALGKQGLHVVEDDDLHLDALHNRALNGTDVPAVPNVDCATVIGAISGGCAGAFRKVTTYFANHWNSNKDTYRRLSKHPITGIVATGAIGIGTSSYTYYLGKKSGNTAPSTCSGALDSLHGVYVTLKDQCYNKADSQKRCLEVCEAALVRSDTGDSDTFVLEAHEN